MGATMCLLAVLFSIHGHVETSLIDQIPCDWWVAAALLVVLRESLALPAVAFATVTVENCDSIMSAASDMASL